MQLLKTMSAQNRDQPGMEMVQNEYENVQPTSRVRNNEKLETMIRETSKSVQSNRKLMWLSLIFPLLIFTVGFVAIHFSISAKVEMETRQALQITLLKQITSSTEAIQSAERSLTMWKAMNANYSSRLTATNNNIESIQTTLTALEAQLISVTSGLKSIQKKHAKYQTQLVSSVTSGLKSIQEQHTNYQSTLQHNMSNMESKQDTLQNNMSTMVSKLSYLQDYLGIISAQVTSGIENFSFFDDLSKSASSIFPSSLPNYYRYNYDGGNYYIRDGGNNMYNGGNEVYVWAYSQSSVTVFYNTTYSDPLGNFLTVCKAGHPFVLSMLVLNRDGGSRRYYIRVNDYTGTSGRGNYSWDTGSLLVGSYNIHYVLYQVYGAGNPSIIQIFFKVSSPILGSNGNSSLHYSDHNRGTRYTYNKVYMSGTAHNVYFNYILASTYLSSNSTYVQASTIEQILRRIFQNFSV